MKSMTGYGRFENHVENVTLTVEIKSVNHRFCEIEVHLPRSLSVFEDRVKKMVQDNVHRGRVDVNIHVNTEQWARRTVHVDWELAQHYYDAAKRLKEHFELDGELSVRDFLSIPECFEIQEQADARLFGDVLSDTVHRATEDLVRMRMAEGEELAEDLHGRLMMMSATAEKIAEFAPHVQKDYHMRLEAKVKEFLEQRVEVDESRLLHEVILFAEKSDIEEELTRLRSHLSQFEHILTHDGAIGRKLDFLVQEMNREINTLGSKAQAIEMSKWVVELKSELEKIREQVQNIE